MFEWDNKKNIINTEKHGVSFDDAVKAFSDPNRITLFDGGHSQTEDRYFCIGKVDGGILTVRFVIRDGVIRIIGAGYWRKGKQRYEER
jgi:uncharacterized DUF497 family protein